MTLGTVTDASAHRRDEYLQASRIGLRPDAVSIELDLTPGIEVAASIVALIDRDRDGQLSAEEERMYAADVVRALEIKVDEDPLQVRMVSSAFPDASALRTGEGTIRLRAAATHRSLAAGPHRLFLRNTHHDSQSAYLANALVPDTAQISMIEQRRDPRQTRLTIDYTVRAAPVIAGRAWLLVGLPVAALLMLRLTRRL